VKFKPIHTFIYVIVEDYEMTQFDVTTTFLHGDLDEEIYMDQPEGFMSEGVKPKMIDFKKTFMVCTQHIGNGMKNLIRCFLPLTYAKVV
jgi:hypothetical protein